MNLTKLWSWLQSALCCLVHDPKRWYIDMFGLREHALGAIHRFHQKFTKVSLTLWTIDNRTSKLSYWSTCNFCYMSTSKLCIYTDYMVAFENSASIYYIEKLNNDEYPTDRKRLSIKYDFKCAKQPLGSLHCKYYVCEHHRICG
jgi:hypothetical protein